MTRFSLPVTRRSSPGIYPADLGEQCLAAGKLLMAASLHHWMDGWCAAMMGDKAAGVLLEALRDDGGCLKNGDLRLVQAFVGAHDCQRRAIAQKAIRAGSSKARKKKRRSLNKESGFFQGFAQKNGLFLLQRESSTYMHCSAIFKSANLP